MASLASSGHVKTSLAVAVLVLPDRFPFRVNCATAIQVFAWFGENLADNPCSPSLPGGALLCASSPLTGTLVGPAAAGV